MENTAIPTEIQWRKSTYSGDQGGSCVECAPLGALAWRKSTYSSDQGGECVEIAEAPCATIAIRDSKTPAGPTLTLDPAAFTTFVNWTTKGDYNR
ncbi:DUF397 domain-containing protein [Streptomyces sp. NBC_01236]|uniref:DUF397 domain-containing protein n=1 Tax=Streptomyces sp. NBC_01236 TaxID=2903789 RepID=UPI002E15955D|nr:DUF397 domain-containing protein [Streptomyces sp. NBC_01236]